MLKQTAALCTAILLILGCKAEKGPGYDVLSVTPAAAMIAAADMYPLDAGHRALLVTLGDDAGTTVIRRLATTDLYDASWVSDEGELRSEFWRLDEQGNLVMPAVIAHGDRAVTFFNPPLVIAYRQMPPGETLTQTVKMRVMDARKPDKLKDYGTAERSIEYVDDPLLRTPLGELATRRVRITFTADLKLAVAETTATLFVAPGIGAVVEQRDDVVRVLQVPVRHSEQTLVLTEIPPRSGQPSPPAR